MRLNGATSGLWACLIGLSTACEVVLISDDRGSTTEAKSVISYAQWLSPTEPYSRNSTTFSFKADGVKINVVRLKSYNGAGSNGTNDTIASTTLVASAMDATPPSQAGTPGLPDKRDFKQDTVYGENLIQQGDDAHSVDLLWHNILSKVDASQPLYLECEWNNQSLSGTSTTLLFTTECNEPISQPVEERQELGNTTVYYPARQEFISSSTTLSSPPGMTSGTAGTTGSQPSSLPEHDGLSKEDTIGIAVGVSVGGLLVIGLLVWYFYIRLRHRRNPTHHVMPSDASNLAMTDKDAPLAAEPSPPEFGHGDGEYTLDIPPYPAYSDHPPVLPMPLHTTADVSPATSQTDPPGTETAPTPAPVIASRYAHLVEEGMSDEEIRRLEEEERQLDAEIANAVRRGSQ